MNYSEQLLDESIRLAKNHINKGTAFWFNIDFVDFNSFNHHYGYEEGDFLLKQMEEFLSSSANIVLCHREFSDEFVFLLITDTPQSDEEILAIGNSYIYTFIGMHQYNYPSYKMELSCGICPTFSESPVDDIEHASAARKEARESEETSVVLFSKNIIEEHEAYMKREAEIAETMQAGRIIFDLQPKVNIKTGEIVSAEALARQISPEGQKLYPNHFIDIMEENETVVELDFLILEKVCEYMADRISKGLPVTRTAVNVSRLHTQNPSTAALLDAIVQKHKIPPELLEFELTESVFLDELDGARQIVTELHEYGYLTSIDDFGSGYAGLNLCQEMDFDIIKLDKRFLSEDENMKKKNKIIIPSIVDMMHKMGVHVVCEGAETKEQIDFLREANCSIVQGYYFSKPLPPDEFYRIYDEQGGYYPI